MGVGVLAQPAIFIEPRERVKAVLVVNDFLSFAGSAVRLGSAGRWCSGKRGSGATMTKPH